MKHIAAPLLALALALAAPAFPRNPARIAAETVIPDPSAKARRQTIVSHGTDLDSVSLIEFLNIGFVEGRLPKGLPPQPNMKAQVVNAAIVELGMTGAADGVPVLSRFARRDIPEGARKIIARDFETVPLELAEEQQVTLQRALSINAIVSLGMIGEPSAIPAIREAMALDRASGFATAGALSLAQCGNGEGLPPLVDVASGTDAADANEAFRLIYVITGRNYGVTENTAAASRRRKVIEVQTWLATEGVGFTPDRADVMRRFQTRLPSAPIEEKSTRGILRSSMDFRNFDNRYYARQMLERESANRYDELKVIAQDPDEDLDIRLGAMRWISSAVPDKSQSIIRRLKKDENPQIAEAAVGLDKAIDEDRLARKKKPRK